MEKLESLNYSFWKYFKEISSIPRKSSEENQISDYLIKFAKERKLKYYTDQYYNVVIWKDASVGYEYKEILGLQCHTDMICEKRLNTEHNFSKDPLQLIIDGDFIKANNTTLGADNGIGVAYILSILDSKKIQAPKLECIFTTQEETTMNGANYIDASILQSKRIISFDNFRDDEMWISSATAKEWSSVIKDSKVEQISDKFSTFCLNLSHFKGGHSGLDIGDTSRGNPIKIVSEVLNCFSDIYISEFNGGSKGNIIPRNCKIIFSINNYELSKLSILYSKINNLKKQYPVADINFSKIDTVTHSYTKQTSKNILNFINNFQNGSIAKDNLGNIILSGNFGAIKTEYNSISLLYSIRYNSNDLGQRLENEIKNLMEQNNVINSDYTHILGYEQNENSKLIKTCENLYRKYFNKEIKKIKVQACLECGYFSQKIPNLQFIAIAPNIYDAHSPSERMSIKSANKMWNFIIKILESIK